MCHDQLTAPVSGGSGCEVREISIAGEGRTLPARLAVPVSSDPAPGIVLFHDIWGANQFYQDFNLRIAEAGFVSMLPDFFVREGPLESETRDAAFARRESMNQMTAIRDLSGAINLLKQHPACNGKVSVVGFCLGGTFAMLSVAREPLPDAAVAFYGFPMGHEGWETRPVDEAQYVRSPLLFLVGEEDAGVGMDNVEAYTEAVSSHGGSIDTVTYPGAPHAFMTFDPDGEFASESADAWDRMLTFLRGELAE